MPTPKQQAASRANAQKSTGPRTTAGKAVSRFNALKHGIFAVHQVMFDEKAEDLAELTWAGTNGAIASLDESPLNGSVLWAGTDDGRVQVTRDGGGHC